jgi:DNA mismatch endonuclease, patch repair protein
MRKILWGLGIRYRKNDFRLPGKPDIAIYRYKIAVFIDGEFWHGYNWEQKKLSIKSNRDFWIPKIERNIDRDKQVNTMLQELGWRILRFWDQDIKNQLAQCLKHILHEIELSETGQYLQKASQRKKATSRN